MIRTKSHLLYRDFFPFLVNKTTYSHVCSFFPFSNFDTPSFQVQRFSTFFVVWFKKKLFLFFSLIFPKAFLKVWWLLSWFTRFPALQRNLQKKNCSSSEIHTKRILWVRSNASPNTSTRREIYQISSITFYCLVMYRSCYRNWPTSASNINICTVFFIDILKSK